MTNVYSEVVNKDYIQSILNSSVNLSSTDYKDLTQLKTYTIDDLDSAEIDDGVSIEYLDNSTKIWVHIASPAEYLSFEDPIDIEASLKAATCYLPESPEYMLPNDLVTKLLSLKPGRISAALSVSAEINSAGEIVSSNLYRTIIKPTIALTYEDADDILDLQPLEEKELIDLSILMGNRRSYRVSKGSINIEEEEGIFYFQDNVIKHKIKDATRSRKLVSESMILFGYILAEFSKTNKICIPFRVQNQQNISINTSKANNYIDMHICNFLIKNQLSKSYISLTPEAHTSLGLPAYVQATSPLRRYIDLLTHYQILNYLKGINQISEDLVLERIDLFNSRNKQVIQRFRSAKRQLCLNWLDQSEYNDWESVFLKWLNPSKNLALIYIPKLRIDLSCNLLNSNNPTLGSRIVVSIKSIDTEKDSIMLKVL